MPVILQSVNKLPNDSMKQMHCSIGIDTNEARRIAIAIHNTVCIVLPVEGVIFADFISNRKLNIKLIRWVIRKLIKYPIIPYFGNKKNNNSKSKSAVKILYRTEIFCCPSPLFMASMKISQ